MTTSRQQPLDPRHLLTIDVAAEVRKLAEAQIEGTWQIPAETVRLFLGSGARRVSVRLGRAAFTVRSGGAGLDPALLRSFATLTDESASPAGRHRALVALESAGALALIALAGLPRLHLCVDAGGTFLEVRGLRLDRDRARRFLEQACRFAGAPVTLDGRDVTLGFDDALAEATLAPPLGGRIAIPARCAGARLWLLVHGVVAAHLTVPGVPCFEAAVEVRGGAAAMPGAAALRDAIAPQIPALVDQALGFLIALGQGIRQFGDADQRRIRQLLLSAAQKHRRASEVFRLPLFRALVGPRVEERWLTLLDVGSTAAGSLLALYPEQDPAAFALPAAPVLVLDAQERSRLGELLGLGFLPPPCRPGVRRFRQFLWASIGTAKQWLRAPLHRRRRPIPDDCLSAEERALVSALRRSAAATGDSADVRVCEGSGPVRRARGSVWLLPRGNPIVAACGRAIARDPACLYPAWFALFEGRESVPEGVRTFVSAVSTTSVARPRMTTEPARDPDHDRDPWAPGGRLSGLRPVTNRAPGATNRLLLSP